MNETRKTQSAPNSAPAAGQAWVSVDDRLPEDDTEVIVLYWPYDNRENKQVAGHAHFYDGCFFAEDWNPHHPPSHWMPMPAIPADDRAAATSTSTAGQPVVFMGVDPLNIAKGATLPMIHDSWRFGFYQSGDELRFGYQDSGPLVAWDAVKNLAAPLDRADFERFCDDMIDGTDTVSRDWLFHFCTTLLARRAAAKGAAGQEGS